MGYRRAAPHQTPELDPYTAFTAIPVLDDRVLVDRRETAGVSTTGIAQPGQRKRFYRHMNQTIADMIRELHFTYRWTRRELAEFFRISRPSVSQIISNQVWTR